MDLMCTALEAPVPLPTSILSGLGRGYLRDIFRAPDEEQVRQIIALWPKLVLTAKASQVLDKHITSASNALCVYLNCGIASSVPAVQDLVLSRDTWFEAFQCAHKAFDDGKTKPAFQIMETLCDIVRKMSDQEAVAEILESATLPLIRTVLLSSPRSDVKKACLMLSCLLRRSAIGESLELFIQQSTVQDLLRWNQQLLKHNISPSEVLCIGNGKMASLFLALIFASMDADTGSAAMKLYSTLCVRNAEQSDSANLQIISEQAVELYLEKNHEALGDFTQNVLPVMLGNRETFMAFVNPRCRSCRQSESAFALFLSSLRVGISKNLLSDAEALTFVNSAFTTLPYSGRYEQDRYRWLRHTFMISSSQIRILTYALLTANPAANAVIDPEALDCIASSLKYLHEDADAHERGEILSITKRLLSKIQTSYSSLCRKSAQTDDDVEFNAVIHQYRSFSSRLYDFLQGELGVGVSYPRHILSLQSLQYFFSLAIEPPTAEGQLVLTRSLCNLTLDPFEDVRDNAAVLLRTLALRNPRAASHVGTFDFLLKVEMLAVQTVRGDHADGMGRLWAALSVLHDSDELVESSFKTEMTRNMSRLENATSKDGNIRPGSHFPVHGYLLAVYYQMQNLHSLSDQDSIQSRVFSVCHKIWEEVRPQLCVDSPETATELADDEGNEGPKDLLAYSWRALRDSSLVIQALIRVCHPDREVYAVAGRLCMDQLMSLRHRGAFSTVAQTFLTCCDSVRSSTQAAIRKLIHEWYKIALDQIDEQGNRLTRRSAGLPAMMTALLSPLDSDFFASAVSDLMTIARLPSIDLESDAGEAKLPQVHALNCLKDIMTSSRFSGLIVHFLPSILELAAYCLSSKIWAIRNCGLMLLRACINRINSTNTIEQHGPREPSVELSNDETPTRVALRLLGSARDGQTSDTWSKDTEHVFAGLDLLAHAQQEETKSKSLILTIAGELSNPTWAVRDQAAYLIARRLSSIGPCLAASRILETVGPIWSENAAHGVLLCCKYLMMETRQTITEADLNSIVTLLANELARSIATNWRSPYVSAAWLDVLNEAAVYTWDNGWDYEIIEKFSHGNEAHAAMGSNSGHSAYLSERFLLHQVYRHLLRAKPGSSEAEVSTQLVQNLVANSEASSYCVKTANERLCDTPRFSLLTLLVDVIAETYQKGAGQADVLEHAFSCVEQCLRLGVKPDLRSWHVLEQDVVLEQLGPTRDLWNAALKLESHILAGFVLPHEGYHAARKRVTLWLDAVRHASMDYLDFPTRLSAAAALSRFIEHLQSIHDGAAGEGLKLPLLLVLYDLLNDDDEEVRNEAVSAAAKLSLKHSSTVDSLGPCALAARETLLEELCLQYGQTTLFAEAALLKLMQVGQDTNSSFYYKGPSGLFETSVASRIHEILKSKNDLFAEEKQNLYVDDVREISCWTRALSRSAFHSLSPEQIQAAYDWTLEGLDRTLVSLQDSHTSEQFSSPSEVDMSRSLGMKNNQLPRSMLVHPLGPTYDHEFLVIFLQVVSLANILLVFDQVGNSKALNLMRQKLEQVASLLAKTNGNVTFTAAVTRALEGKCSEK